MQYDWEVTCGVFNIANLKIVITKVYSCLRFERHCFLSTPYKQFLEGTPRNKSSKYEMPKESPTRAVF
jgi:hypothetical protein